MGSKNLKAIAVRGTGGVRVADVKALEAAVWAARAKLAAHPVAQGLNKHGTDILVNILNETGCLPTRNYQDGHFPQADKVGGESLTKEVLTRRKGCFACVISCGRVTRVSNPKFAGEGEGPEYEAAWGYGPDCGVDNLDAATKANHLCNELGLDSISAPATIACAIDMAESGLLPAKDFDGLDIRWGNAELIVELTKRIALRQGIGDKLALGSYRFAEMYGHPEYSMTSKKQEIPAYDARGIQGIGLEYATCNRGGCHVKGYTIAVEVLASGNVRMDPREIKGKPALVKAFQDMTAAVDASGGCIFGTFGMVADDYAAMLSALTGVHYSADDYVKAGERIWNLERVFNLEGRVSRRKMTRCPSAYLKARSRQVHRKAWSAACPKCCRSITACVVGPIRACHRPRSCVNCNWLDHRTADSRSETNDGQILWRYPAAHGYQGGRVASSASRRPVPAERVGRKARRPSETACSKEINSAAPSSFWSMAGVSTTSRA